MCVSLYGDDDRVQGEDVEVELMKKRKKKKQLEQNNSVLEKKKEEKYKSVSEWTKKN